MSETRRHKWQPMLDPEKGTVYLTSDITDESVHTARLELLEIQDQKKPPPYALLVISSNGGDLGAAFSLVDTIRAMSLPVATLATGKCASAAFLLLISGAKGKRYATENTPLMSHQHYAGMDGKAHDLLAYQKCTSLHDDIMLEIYKRATGNSRRFVRKHLLPPTDVWLSAKEALRMGCIDEVISVKDSGKPKR